MSETSETVETTPVNGAGGNGAVIEVAQSERGAYHVVYDYDRKTASLISIDVFGSINVLAVKSYLEIGKSR